jgi:hypothetical protein
MKKKLSTKKSFKRKPSGRPVVAYLIAAFVIVFVLAVAGKIVISLTNGPVKASDMAYTLTPVESEYSVGDTISIPVYLNGDETENATALDIKFKYDKKKLQLVSATPGQFYDKYLTVKWDDEAAWYALAMTPSEEPRYSNPESPVLTLEFTALEATPATNITTDSSTVYIANTGGFHPQTGKATIKIQ